MIISASLPIDQSNSINTIVPSFKFRNSVLAPVFVAGQERIVFQEIAPTRVFRGVIGGEYVFSVGSPPAGATNVVIISES